MAQSGSSIFVTNSRFAVLNVEDDDPPPAEPVCKEKLRVLEDAPSKKKIKKKKRQMEAAKAATDAEMHLKQLAFGNPLRYYTDPTKFCCTRPDPSHKQWSEWKEKDEEFTQDSYQKDLEEALLASKQAYEKDQQKLKEKPVNGVEGKKKKKKTLSLDQFNNMPVKEKSGHSDCKQKNGECSRATACVKTTASVKTSVGEGDTHFFDNVDDDVHKIVTKEKIQEEYKKHYAIESSMLQRYRTQLAKKDREISSLSTSLTELQEEFIQVKKRNKQLCCIMAQGEMKDKAQVLMHVDDLTQVRNELTEQLTELNVQLEKERSKVHALRMENEKLKGGGKHHAK